ncbi:MAG: UDP-2,3-diacylglucosamine diphosphatase LpxI [Pelagimonas sp.]|jgi:DUF1009 family protein|nr:UDP-2,3-diacylglucosamine diphosphatase LpxI [Pelagimonas sp.]
MLALIAGRGMLPGAVLAQTTQRPVVCGMIQSPPDHVTADEMFRIERFGGLLRRLQRQGVTQICMCGAQDRPEFRLLQLDWATLRLVPRLLRVLRRGEDSALRLIIEIIEAHGMTVVGAHEIAPQLLPPAGTLTTAKPDARAQHEALLGDDVSDDQARRDLGQASLIRDDGVLLREGPEGTESLLNSASGGEAEGAILYKSPKPGQDLRVDMPVIGPDTAVQAARAGLRGIVIEEGGVMVLGLSDVLRRLNAEGMFLWVRKRPI